MELREFALRVVKSASIDEKLAHPPKLTDRDSGPPMRLDRPGRPDNLRIVPAQEARIPSIEGFQDLQQRQKIIHSFANHELQAVELFAWALLAFPDAPSEFRMGLLNVLKDEQRHSRMYRARLADWNIDLGHYPVTGYFWNKVEGLEAPLHFVCAMSLTFENANLDHTVDYSSEAQRLGDTKTAALISQIHIDEIEHVRFGWSWLLKLKPPSQTPWDAYCANVSWPLRPSLARGERFHQSGRVAAGLDPEFIRLLEQSKRQAEGKHGGRIRRHER